MNTLNKLFIDISSINIFTLLINIILIVIQSSRINDYIHEIGHCVTIYITKYIIRFNEKIKVTIKYKGDNKKTKILKTYSNFYSFLDKSDKHKYRNIIRINTLGGLIAETTFTICLFFIVNKYIKIFVIVIYITNTIYPFIKRKNITTSDLYTLKYPEHFKYTTLEEDMK